MDLSESLRDVRNVNGRIPSGLTASGRCAFYGRNNGLWFQLAIGAPICNKISGAFLLDSFRRTPHMPLPSRNAVSSSQSTQSRRAVPSPIKQTTTEHFLIF